jgi:hypothetical protein
MKESENVNNIGYDDFESCESNPFIGFDNKIIGTKRVRYGQAIEEVSTSESGELVSSYHKIGTTEIVDSEKFVQVYIKGLDQLFGLGLQAQKIIKYIIEYCIKPNDDRIYFSKSDCMKKLGYKTRKSIYSGLLELLTKQIIAKVKGDNNLLFINPHYLFNGKRFAFFQAYEKAGDDFDKNRFDDVKKLNL